MVSLSKLPVWAEKLIESERVARLGIVDDDGRPRVLPITFAVADGAVWSAIDRKPKRTTELARLRWLRARPEATLLIDVYSDDWDRLAWVQLLGRIQIVDIGAAPAVLEALEALAAKYSPYRREPPPGPLLRLEVESSRCWRAASQG